jgi:solute carrier family 39 (zinc transporter), member 9
MTNATTARYELVSCCGALVYPTLPLTQPASFGLCTLLMGRRLHKRDIRKAILIFSMSTPVGAILSECCRFETMQPCTALLTSSMSFFADKLAYLFLSVILTSDSGDNISPSHIGIALTFSAGTFIFVAMHAVQELASASADIDEGERDSGNALHLHHQHRHPSSADPKQILGRTGRVAVFLLGTILPKTLQSLTGHGH